MAVEYLNGPRVWSSTNAVSNAAAADYTIAVGFRPSALVFYNTGANEVFISFTGTAVVTSGVATMRIPSGKDLAVNFSNQNEGAGTGTDYKVSMISSTGATTVLINAIGDR